MENYGNESSQLNRLLEKHKQLQERSAFKSMYESQAMQNNINYFNSVNNNFHERGHISHMHQQHIPTSENKVVYVNPNYKPKVYVNPHVNIPPPPVVNHHFNMIPPMVNPYVNMGVNIMPPMINPYVNMMPIVNYANQVTVYPYIHAMPSYNHMNQVEVHPQFNMMIPPMHINPQIGNSHINMYNANNNISPSIAINPCENMLPTINSVNNHSDKESSIHVNPNKLKIRNILNQNQIKVSQSNVQDNHCIAQSTIKSKSIHVNPKLIKLRSKNLDTPLMPDTQTTTTAASIFTAESTTSVSNMTDSLKTETENKFVTSDTPTNIKKKSAAINCNVVRKKSATNYTKKGNNVKKSPNSSFVAISRRKLIRVRKSPKTVTVSSSTPKLITPIRRRLSSTSLKKLKVSPVKATSSSSTNQLIKLNSLKSVKNADLYKNNWYNKVYKSAIKSSSRKLVIDSKKLLNSANNLVSIGGVIYKSSRNKLILNNASASTAKRKTSLTSNKSNQFFVTKDGKKLLKIDSEQKKLNVSTVKMNTSISPVKSYKTNASNKVKQRSLQILRNKMRKNNQPCLLFQKFGYCANQLKGTCPKVHDRNQVALCRNFLQGKCLLDECPLSHNIGPEKMPTCKYFLEGCCTRDECPYLHVKVSAKSPICVEFLRGYCPRGNECQNRHIHACPEFDKSGNCSKGKFCPYPHKSQLTETKRYKRNSKGTRKSNVIAKQLENSSINSPINPEVTAPNRKRYYDEVPEDLNQKRENLYKNLNIIKKVHAVQSNNSDEAQTSVNSEENNVSEPNESNNEEKLEFVCNKPRRPPIGPLPAYIPID